MANMEYVNLGLKLGNMNAVGRYIYILLVVMVILPVDLFGSGVAVAPWFALFLGIMYALFLNALIRSSIKRPPSIFFRHQWWGSVSA